MLNKTWTGAPVIPDQLKDIEPEEQFTSRTSPAMIELGKKAGVSPIKAEYLFKSYTGTLGGHMLDALDAMYWDKDKFGEMPQSTEFDNPFLKRFIRSNNPYRTTYENKFFDRLEASRKYIKTLKTKYDPKRGIFDQAAMSEQVTADDFADDSFAGYSKEEKFILAGLSKRLNNISKALYGRGGLKDQEMVIKYNPNLS